MVKNKILKKVLPLFLMTVFFFLFASCGSDNYEANITVVSDAADGLDLQAVTALIKKVKTGEELEKRLNEQNGINNLDLNEDGKIDYIKVTEYGGENNTYGFSLTTEPVQGETQEIASIEVTKIGEDAQVTTRGNRNVYGNDHYYRENHFWRNMFLFSYFSRGFGMYHSPYHYGYGGGYRTVTRTVYRDRAQGYTKGSKVSKAKNAGSSKISSKNPNKGKSASKGITSKLRSPTTTQKAFSKRNPSKTAKSGGFGRKSSSGMRKSSSSRSRSSGGFGK